MRPFLFRAIVFGLLVVAVLLAIYGVNRYFLAKGVPVLQGNVLLLGDSHIQTGVDPGNMDGAVNVAQMAEPYTITVHKLNAVLAANPQIETVVLGFGPHNLSRLEERKFHDPQFADELFNRIYPIMGLGNLHGLQVDRTKFYWSRFRNLFLVPKTDHLAYLGSFNRTKHQLSRTKVSVALQRHYFQYGEVLGISERARSNLNTIVTLTEEKGIRLILLATPLHADYREGIPASFSEAFRDVAAEMRSRGVTVLDYSAHPVDDVDFRDHDHLCGTGAAKMGGWLQAYLDEHPAP